MMGTLQMGDIESNEPDELVLVRPAGESTNQNDKQESGVMGQSADDDGEGIGEGAELFGNSSRRAGNKSPRPKKASKTPRAPILMKPKSMHLVPMNCKNFYVQPDPDAWA